MTQLDHDEWVVGKAGSALRDLANPDGYRRRDQRERAGSALPGRSILTEPEDRQRLLHAALTVAAASVLVAGLREVWYDAVPRHLGLAVFAVATFPLLVAAVVISAAAKTERIRSLSDVGLMLIGSLMLLVLLRGSISSGHPAYGVDVGWVIQEGANELARTGHLYGVFWPLAPREFAASGEPSGLTYLFDGTIVNDFGYPPMGAMLAAVTTAASGLAATAAVWPVIGLLCAAAILFVRLPNPLRPLSVIVCFGLPRLTGMAFSGYPSLIALPLMMMAVAWWPSIGAGGRLSRRDYVGACCLGMAATAHQLVWVVAPFLLVGVWLVRRGTTKPRRATVIMFRYAVVAASVFVLLNGWFLLREPRAWLRGVLEPLTQAAVPHGQCLVTFVLFWSRGSGNLAWFSLAVALTAVGLLAMAVLFLRVLGPGLLALPAFIFLVSLQSHDNYLVALAPLWLLGAVAAIESGDYRLAYEPLGRLRAPIRLMIPTSLLLAALGCVAAGLATAPPLKMSQLSYSTSGGIVSNVGAQVANVSDRSVRPVFSVTSGASTVNNVWAIARGPAILGPRTTATYVLVPVEAQERPPGGRRQLMVRALTTGPNAITNAPLDAKTAARNVRRAVLLADWAVSSRKAGDPARLIVQLRDGNNADLRDPGVSIELRATTLGSSTPTAAGLLVNRQTMPPSGRVTALTDDSGRATFDVSSTQERQDPVVFRAAVSAGGQSLGSVMVLWH
ncbi:MAG TPA: hypothetical protein VHR39_12505 [Propionibacteriaceae bacterium]|nr:hypothetical protein [Propionibacteriaceae bacterium]